MYPVILAGVIVLLLYYFFLDGLKEYFRYVKLSRSLPSPKGLPGLGHISDLVVPPEDQFLCIRKWCLEQYPVFMIAAGPYLTVHICGPKEIEAVLAVSKHMTKAHIYGFLSYWMGEGLLTSSGSKWHLRRKILTPTFHFGILQKFLNVFNKETQKMVENLCKEIDKPHTDIKSHITELTLNTITETSMGLQPNTESFESRKYRESVYDMAGILIYRTARPWFYEKYIWYASPVGRKETKVVKNMHQFTEKVISAKSQNFELFDENQMEDTYTKRKKMAMLDLLINAKIKDGLIDDVGIRDEVNTFMFEGHDTTAVSLGFTLMLLANHKNIQDTIVEEMAEIIQDWDRPPTYNELQGLNYMERCIKESLRLYPSVPFIARLLDDDIVTSQGYTMPKGAECMIHIYDLHRNPNIWDDPDKFDPDRFLLENCQGRHPFAYIPFSAGSRNCIGQRYAILEIKAVLCGILKKFELHPIDTPESIVLVQDLVLRTKDNIKVKFLPRKPVI